MTIERTLHVSRRRPQTEGRRLVRTASAQIGSGREQRATSTGRPCYGDGGALSGRGWPVSSSQRALNLVVHTFVIFLSSRTSYIRQVFHDNVNGDSTFSGASLKETSTNDTRTYTWRVYVRVTVAAHPGTKERDKWKGASDRHRDIRRNSVC